MPRRTGKNYKHIVHLATSIPWHILPSKLEEITEVLSLRAAGYELTEREIAARLGHDAPGVQNGLLDEMLADLPDLIERSGDLAVVNIEGTLAPKMSSLMRISGGTDTREIGRAVEQLAADDSVRVILLAIDSPGGSAMGLEEAARKIRAAAEVKEVIALADGLCCSAAYYLASQAGAIVASPSAMVGSIGSLAIHFEQSKADERVGYRYTIVKAGEHKADGNQYQPLDEQGHATLQETVDAYYRQFVDAVASGREIDASAVETGYGQGKTFIASEALARGMVDEIADLDEILARIQAEAPAPRTTTNNTLPQPIGACDMSRKRTIVSATRAEETKPAPGEEMPDEPTTEELPEEPTGEEGEEDDPAPDGETSSETTSRQLAATVAQIHPGIETAARREGALAERTRIADIKARGALLGVGDQIINQAVESGHSVEDFVMAATSHGAETRPPIGRLTPGENQQDAFTRDATSALSVRLGLSPDPKANTANLRYASMMEMAKTSLRISGRETYLDGDPEEVAKAALQGPAFVVRAEAGAVHGPGNFPNILSGIASKVLAESDPYAETTFQNWTYRLPSLPDFKPATIVALGEGSEFPMIPDGMAYEEDTNTEHVEWIATDRFGKKFKLTPRMITDDDLGAFQIAIEDAQAAWGATQNRLCVNLLTGNVTLTDGYSLFDSDNHANVVATPAAPSDDELSAMRLLLRNMTGHSGLRKLNYTLRKLLVPAALETTVEKLLNVTLQVFASSVTNTAGFKGKVDFEVEPLLDDSSTTAYYGFADIRRGRAIGIAAQRGFETMKTRSWYDEETGCRNWSFEGRFGAAVMNHRAVVYNAGTS